jgi:2-isopropylmalate synthase
MVKSMKIYDTTLRDGTQNKEINLTARDKLSIIEILDDAKVDYIELGWPGSNPKDMEAFLEADKMKLSHSKISAFCSTRRKNVLASEDNNLKAVIASKAKVACMFGKTWIDHISKQLGITPEENLEAIRDSITFLKENKLDVFYDAEHFFDGYKDNKKYALECLRVAFDAGAEVVILCDTNGGCLPDEIKTIVQDVKQNFMNKKLGIHCHNDSGCAVANSLIAANLLDQIQGTINGFGERAGNADLCQIIPGLELKLGIQTNFILKKMKEVSEKVYILSNQKDLPNQPYVGKNAFAHKGGIHVDAISKGAVYEHVNPKSVGNERNVVLSDLAGTANIVEVLRKYSLNVDKNDERVREMLSEVKELEKKGYDIGDIEAEKYLLVNKHFLNKETFKILGWKITMKKENGNEVSECCLDVNIKGNLETAKAKVNGGPVDSAYGALSNVLKRMYKNVENIRLINYKVMIAEDKGPESSVRVYIEFKEGEEEFACIGVSTNIIEASIEAIEKAFRYYILKKYLN